MNSFNTMENQLNTDHIPMMPLWKIWMLAARPKTLTTAFVPIFVASALSFHLTGGVNLSVCFCTLIAALFIQIGTNFFNDAIDFKKGADTEERLGPLRVTQAGLLPAKQVIAMGFACFGLASLATLPLIFIGGMPIVYLLLFSLISGYAYTGGPYPIAYLGLGEVFVILFFGLIATGAVFFLQTGTLSTAAVVAGVQLGLLASAIIAINNLRDREQDQKAAKKTFAVRFGKQAAERALLLMLLCPYLLNFLWIFSSMSFAGLLPFLALPLAIAIYYKVNQTPPSKIYNDFLGLTALHHLLFGLLLTAGVLLS